jgi:hypothetical protein
MPPTRHSTEVCDGADSRTATDEAQPGGGSKTPPTRHSPEVCAGADKQDAADEAQLGDVRWSRQQTRHRRGKPGGGSKTPPTRHSPEAIRCCRQQTGNRRGTAWRGALEPAAETPPVWHSMEVCARDGSRAATDAAQPEGTRRM